jgi:alcohol dehydrogenase class IV
VCEANVKALQSREPSSAALARYDEVAQILTGKGDAKAADGVEWVQDLCEVLKVPALAEFGLKERDFTTVVGKAQKSSSMKGNPIQLNDDELMEILKESQ